PNRCEGGTNLVLMEYMACGKPVIGAYNSGHRDILTDRNSIPLRAMRSISVSHGGQPVAVWEEPQLEELIARLDWAYHHRTELREIGAQAGMDMAGLTWERTARLFLAEMMKGRMHHDRRMQHVE
ncbi:MAG: glycosyltransferase, partial [Bacteroidetes bacterium]|nr:glycosyltransferase [Bacteroidota bacterium]